MKVLNPATGKLIQEIPSASPIDVKNGYTLAREAQREWVSCAFETRAASIRNFRGLLEQELNQCSQILSEEVGKPMNQAKNEIKGTLRRIDWFLDHTQPLIGDHVAHKEKGIEETISFDPLGVVANISAWNYPYFVGCNVIIPALLTGNAVLYKPSEYASLTGLKIDELLHKAGIPTGLFQTFIGTGKVGSYILKQSIDGMFFTGSWATGQSIASELASSFIPLGFELGGKDPVYVCNDIDSKRAAEALVDGSFYNTGQSCCAVERIYVHEAVYGEFIEHFAQQTKSLTICEPGNTDGYIGAITRKQHLNHLDEQCQDALKKGAKYLVEGGKLASEGNFFKPSVLVDVNHDMLIMKEESFGPIIGIQKVSDDQEAVALMNDTQYGLTAGVYTENEERARSILGQIDSGTVYWNCCDRVSVYLPWSGRKRSGIGSTLSELGIKAFLKPKAWHLSQNY
ncbi:MAG: aldehyde dehydrogenase family protein [Oligoflexales bacterium]|nr:aldehyde dehydrogenase family protein [Oligoflexales bacterium]